ncbi:type III secretion protein HrpB4 [Trinickia dinghuensis]|uniref:Type III secretion protein HrpB4 n=1 Tax=Trinickia dinghuensis TaxID=2291023 RepID=A0A3D8JUI1_9BURK|nr:type III secretion protein HrpB4 [Trinickia dinghuensis]RDU96749.1 hypothetical protein DWV00_22415 [Trinickia dinghuensis]
MTDLDGNGGIADVLAQRVRQYAANRLALFEWIHEDWLRGDWRAALREAAKQDGSEQARQRHLRAVDTCLRGFGLAPPPLDAFRGDEGVLAALPMDGLLRALRLRALHFRRAELRYWIDRGSRARLSAWLGSEASGVLRWLMNMPHPPQLDRLMRVAGMPPLDELDDEALAWEGFSLCLRAGWCGPRAPLSLARLAWRPGLAPPDWTDDAGAAAGISDGVAVVRRLPEFFEERA